MIQRKSVQTYLDVHVCLQPFRTPCEHLRTAQSDLLLRRKTLGARRRRPGDAPRHFKPILVHNVQRGAAGEEDEEAAGPKTYSDDAVIPEPLLLWEPGKLLEKRGAKQVAVDPAVRTGLPGQPKVLTCLRKHQREGMQVRMTLLLLLLLVLLLPLLLLLLLLLPVLTSLLPAVPLPVLRRPQALRRLR